MKRYYVHKFCLDDTIVIDTVEKRWAFYDTNYRGQFIELGKPFEKITKQRINGLIKRLSNSRTYYRSDGFVVDSFLYKYILTEEQREAAFGLPREPKELIASGDDLKEVLAEMCEYTLRHCKNASEKDQNYYQDTLEQLFVTN